jgi:hypothetical protein
MNLRKFVVIVTMTLSFGMLAFAADVDGKWTAEVAGRGGNTTTQTLTVKAAGDKLTGSMDGGRGGAVEISDGTIMGTAVAFKVVREFNGNKFEQTYKGTLAGDELKLSMDNGRGRGPQEITFKRAK